MKEQPILGYDWEMGHEEIKLTVLEYSYEFLHIVSGRVYFIHPKSAQPQ